MKNNLYVLISLIVLVFIAYINSLNNSFVSDDIADIVNNPQLGSLEYVISRPFGFIRPVIYLFSFKVGGLTPAIFRSFNILFHLGSVMLIYYILKSLHSKRAAIFAASLFAVHPLLSEAVVWISGGIYTQHAFFFLLAFLLYILSKNSGKKYLFSIITYLLALQSHISAAAFIPILFLYELIYGNLLKNWKKLIPFLILVSIWSFRYSGVIGARSSELQTTHYQQQTGVVNPAVHLPISITTYLQLLFWPNELTLYHSELSVNNIEYIVRTVILILFLGGFIYSFVKQKAIFFWLSFFIMNLLPTMLPSFFGLTSIVAERYVYLSALGILVVFCIFLEKLTRSKKLSPTIYALVLFIVLGLAIRTILRNIDWKNEDNLWIATAKTSPSSPNTHNNMGDVYARHGDLENAAKEFKKAVEIKPNYGDAYHNLANTYQQMGRLDEAIENYSKAISLNPKLWQSYQNIAAIYFAQGDLPKTIENLQQALKIYPANANLYTNLGIVYVKNGEKDKAREAFIYALSLDPQNQKAKLGLEASK